MENETATSSGSPSFSVFPPNRRKWTSVERFVHCINHTRMKHKSKSAPLWPHLWHNKLQYVEIEVLQDNMRFMKTKRGHLGWAADNAKQGDKIFVLKGCSVPVLLRARPEGGYTVVGDAYVHWIMKGEAVRDGQDVTWAMIEIH